jgi:hypothetical protein
MTAMRAVRSAASRLSHGYDGGDNTWTLMVDELPGLKFLPGPVRGIVSLRAQIFDGRRNSANKERASIGPAHG